MNRRRVLDASAALCYLKDEPGAADVAGLLEGALICSVNFAEVVTKLVEHGAGPGWVRRFMTRLGPGVTVIPFDTDLAWRAGLLRATTRHLGLSLGDRACLALATREGGVAVTCDRAWSAVEGITVDVVRP